MEGSGEGRSGFSVVVENLVKRFGGFEALRGVSFRVERGSIFCLVGPNGAGKTTTFRILSTLLAPTSGDAYVEGFNVAREPDRVRRIISYLPEEAGAYKNITGLEYLEIVSRIYLRGREAEEALERGIRISGLSQGDLKRRMKEYSKGMKRRIQVARALMVLPRLAILDEPAAGLDPVQKIDLRKTIRDYSKRFGITTVLSTHEMGEAEEICERIAIISSGRILAQGSLEEILSSQGARRLEEAFERLVRGTRDAG